ncbi:sensor histidine kinase [Oricola nitratireducens]|uniref:sensor histidine kinase n=1 Tax=Oricola nitratireducens TaxID=2775868 RepID=UPI001867CDE6|nr:ATP-binding protein [Oricola nitratireducens]
MATPNGAQLRRRYRLATRAVVGGTLVCLVLSVWLARDWAGARAFDQLRGSAEESLALQIEALTGVMEKYRLIPPLLSRRADIRDLFASPGRERAESMRTLLMRVAGASGARDVAIADIDGNVLASARGLAGTQTIARSGLAVAVSQRRLGRAALRLADGSRAYAFASHIAGPNGHGNVGMIVVMVPFGAIEANWSLSSYPIIVTDAHEFVFLSNRPEWVGKPWKASEAAPGVAPLSYSAGEFMRVPQAANARYVEASRTIPILGWTMHVLADSAPVETARRNAALLAGLAVILAGMIAFLVVVRREMNHARIRREKAQSMRLERLVRDRTAELSEVNVALRNEIEVRRLTEEQLRETQDELVHAAKLAVIGQMSATLSHEYNQPLAAIKTYADNAARMVERGKTAALPDALARIGQMVDRMSALSRTLLAFSRKPGTALVPVPVEPVVGEALLLVGQKAKKAGVAVTTDIEPDLAAHTGRIRLSQIIVNLVGNAVDALCGGEDRAPAGARIAIVARGDGGRVRIEISDNGPGIDPAVREKIFEPFFTTKPVGSGLGLGLSIVDSVVRDLQGSVRVENRDGGACFVIDLPAAGRQVRAAE